MTWVELAWCVLCVAASLGAFAPLIWASSLSSKHKRDRRHYKRYSRTPGSVPPTKPRE